MKQDVIGPALAGTPARPDPKAPIPRQIRYIIGNEGCERFSFYGMRNILTMFLVSSLLLYLPEADREYASKDIFHTFVIGVYFSHCSARSAEPKSLPWRSVRFEGQ